MVRKLFDWAVGNPLVVILLAVALAGVGGYSFVHINVEAYPDPAPAIVEVVAMYPGASAEEVERQVTIPLEVALAGMPGLKASRSKALFGLAFVNNQFDYGTDYNQARQEVINRLRSVELPEGVVPEISPRSPIGEIFRYTLSNPEDALGRPIYSMNDLKTLQNWTLVREFRRLPGIIDVISFGGTRKRYEVRPDPDRLKRYGVTLTQLQEAIAESNANVGGDYMVQGDTVQVVRGLGLLGKGLDPFQRVLGLKDPAAARDILRAEERKRIAEIRRIVVTSTDNVPVRVEDVTEGGPLKSWEEVGAQGVVVANHTRLGRVILSRPSGPSGERDGVEIERGGWVDEDDAVQGLVMLRKGADTLPALKAVEAKIEELNTVPGRLLPGVKIVPYYNRTDLINVTTETVRENLLVGMALVVAILLMFLGNVRSALIIAINLPLALLFAFAVLYLRGRSANLLSIGAVDFGIIVDSSVIVVENIYRKLSTGEDADLPLGSRIVRAAMEVERSLFFSTIVMVCAMLPLFTMTGPEGQIFAPMADTYAFALAGALVLAGTLSPVLCLLLFRRLRPARDNALVRGIKAAYLWQLGYALNHRVLSLAAFLALAGVTAGWAVPRLGREFMPELDEGHMWIRSIFPINISLDEVSDKAKLARSIMRKYPEVELVAAQLGGPDGGTDPTSFYSAEFFVPLRPQHEWPAVKEQVGWRRWIAPKRPRSREELVAELSAELSGTIIGVNWNFSQQIRDNVMEVLSGVQGENSVKIIGPDLDELESVAARVEAALTEVRGLTDVGVYRIKGQSNLEFPIDREKCALWDVSVQDVEDVIQTAVAGKPFTRMIEGEKSFDVTLRWPERLRQSDTAILDIPVNVAGHRVSGGRDDVAGTSLTGPSQSVASIGTSGAMPALAGSTLSTGVSDFGDSPWRRLGDLVTPTDAHGDPAPDATFIHPGASMIYREEGNRMIAVKFGVRGRDLAGAVAEAQRKVGPLVEAPYRIEWSGDFRQMEQAERRMLLIVGLSLALIFLLLYLAFNSLLDGMVIFANVVAMSMGGVWALLLTGTNFNISAAVGFVSVLGVAVLNGLLMVSTFNALRAQGLDVRAAVTRGVERLIRPVTITALAAILGLIPAAFSTRMGSQAQRPLAIVVVGGMIMTLIVANLVPVLYSLYGHREPPAGSGDMAH
ncbi:efflux RND transporter permease subunit [Paludisphaera soli]|uniref:efflux RND transporter permease subunit n=1 Tax=Paludisphaera soli TaxID=2712865 RepID=UPI0013EE1BEB|nr:efflux RND transporter permease subunit [Paludisphaera soli]